MKKRMLLGIALAALLSLGLFSVAIPVPTAHARTASVTHMDGTSASATFTDEYKDASGDTISVVLTVNISTGSIHQPPSKPITNEPGIGLSIIESNTVTGAQLNGAGTASADVSIDGKHLTSASLPGAQVEVGPTGDNPDAFPPYQAVLGPVHWTGEGDITVTTQHLHAEIPDVGSLTANMSGKTRMATAVASSLSYHSPLTGIDVTLTHLTNSPGPFDFPTVLNSGRSTIVLVLHAPLPS